MPLSHLTLVPTPWFVPVIWLALALLAALPLFLRKPLSARYARLAASDWHARVMLRYMPLSTYAWMFAWFKLRLDPMFRELPEFTKPASAPRAILDLGCGIGVAACSLLEWFPDATIHALDPNPARIRVAAAALAPRGRAAVAGAPDFNSPSLPARFDAAFVLDVIHFLSDDALAQTLQRLRARLDTPGRLIIRSAIAPAAGGSLLWKIGALRRKITGSFARHRSTTEVHNAITAAGFTVERSEMSGQNPELFWFVAIPS